MGRLKRVGPLLAAVALFWGVTAWLLHASLARTEGHFTYALDDAYIHMAMAKHLAQDGVWGVTPYGFSSSSSSPLWTLLLAGLFRLFGVHETIPLALNLLFATLALVWIHAQIRDRVSPRWAFLILATAVLAPPLPLMVLGGMEHTLQILLVLMFVSACASRIAAPEAAGPVPASLVALAALLPLTRYEDLFVVCAACVGFLLARRARDAVVLGAVALVAVAAYAAYSVAHGSLPLPNAVLLKGVSPSVMDTLLALPRNLLKTKPVAGLLLLALALLRWDRLDHTLGPRDRALLAMFTLTTLLHLQVAQVGWYFRYEAYLVVLGIVAVGPPLVGDRVGESFVDTSIRAGIARWTLVTLAVLFSWATVLSRVPVLARAPAASQNTYQQQYQTGRFLAGAYGRQVVAVSDLGASNFLADLHCVDLLGLGDIEIARLRLAHGGLTAAEADRILRERGARVAVSCERWFRGGGDAVLLDGVPSRWGDPVGRWAIGECVTCAADTLAFFGMGQAERDTLAVHLRAFASRLPVGVAQSGPYVSAGVAHP